VRYEVLRGRAGITGYVSAESDGLGEAGEDCNKQVVEARGPGEADGCTHGLPLFQVVPLQALQVRVVAACSAPSLPTLEAYPARENDESGQLRGHRERVTSRR
jgi:hypothetical protein